MQGLQVFESRTAEPIDLEARVKDDHLLKRVDRILDLTFVRELTASRYSPDRGRPSIDPEVYLRMMLVAYFYNIPSERQLCEDIEYHIAYRWFCRLSLDDRVPDHSSLSRIRDRFGEDVFEAIFTRIVLTCKEKGLVPERSRVITDATLIPADASLNSMVHNDPEEAKKEAEAERERRSTSPTSPTRKLTNKSHTSRTDPDATLAQKLGTPRALKYKVHQTIDADSRVILDSKVTTGARHDNQPYLDQIKRVRARCQLEIEEAIADRGYGSAEIIRSHQQDGVTTFIPLWSGKVGNSKHVAAEGWVYEKGKDRYRCPAGKYLTRCPSMDGIYQRYASDPSDCQSCPEASNCTAAKKGTRNQRHVLRNVNQDLYEEVQASMRDPTFRQRAAERMWKIEGLFAEAKQHHRLSRARYRGVSKVQIQAYLSAIVMNLKRLVHLFVRWVLIRVRPRRIKLAIN